MTLFLDTETTGLSPANGDTIVEVAIVDSSGRALMLHDDDSEFTHEALNASSVAD